MNLFNKTFDKLLNEDIAAGDGGAFGDFSTPYGGDDMRLAFAVGSKPAKKKCKKRSRKRKCKKMLQASNQVPVVFTRRFPEMHFSRGNTAIR